MSAAREVLLPVAFALAAVVMVIVVAAIALGVIG